MISGDIAAAIVSFLFIGSIAGVSSLRMWLKHKEKEMELRSSGKLGTGTSQEMELLRQEIANLRQMTTQYAMSVESTVHEMKHRVEFLESSIRDSRTPTASIAPPQSSTPRTELPPPVLPKQAIDEPQTQKVGGAH